MQLGSDLEAAVWAMACSVYGPLLNDELGRALALYRRRPGFDELSRLHVYTAGSGLGVLSDALLRHAPAGTYQLHRDYIEIRCRLRWHIVRHLQSLLINLRHASPAIRDDFFASDLGL